MTETESSPKATKKVKKPKVPVDNSKRVKSLEELLKAAEGHETPKAKPSTTESSEVFTLAIGLLDSKVGQWFNAAQLQKYTRFETAKYWSDTLWRLAGGSEHLRYPQRVAKHPEKKGLYGSLQNLQASKSS